MKLDDTVWGALFALLGAAILWHVRSFPNIPGQNIGPALFPGVVATALLVCGALLIVGGWRARRRVEGAARRWVEPPPWLRSPPQLLAFVVFVATSTFYLFAVDRLGFLLTAFVCLAALMSVLRVRPMRALAVAFVLTLLIHYVFYKLLRVPLPWGILQAIAW
ncbi:MAG TPA: tripartite tricarboxylate transporter TctB family protein [Caldimonas sp.]